jgi:hypothetical protein
VKSLIKLAILMIAILGIVGVAQAGELRLMNTTQVRALYPKGSVLSPVMGSNGSQLVFLIVRDQNLNPVVGAASLLTVHFPNDVQEWVMPNTDEIGVSRLLLEIKNQPPGTRVVLEFQVGFEELEASTRDSFRIWW